MTPAARHEPASTGRGDVLRGLALAAALEAVTLGARFGLGLQSTRDTGFLRHLTFGLRVHHGYLGVLMVLGSLALTDARHRRWARILGVGLVVSDLVHHFLVLWPLTGSPQFDLWYPAG